MTNKVQVSKGKGSVTEKTQAAYVRTLTREANLGTLVVGCNAVNVWGRKLVKLREA